MYVTESQLVEILGITRQTLVRWRDMGLPHFKGIRLVRYDPKEVANWMRDRLNAKKGAREIKKVIKIKIKVKNQSGKKGLERV